MTTPTSWARATYASRHSSVSTRGPERPPFLFSLLILLMTLAAPHVLRHGPDVRHHAHHRRRRSAALGRHRARPPSSPTSGASRAARPGARATCPALLLGSRCSSAGSAATSRVRRPARRPPGRPGRRRRAQGHRRQAGHADAARRTKLVTVARGQPALPHAVRTSPVALLSSASLLLATFHPASSAATTVPGQGVPGRWRPSSSASSALLLTRGRVPGVPCSWRCSSPSMCCSTTSSTPPPRPRRLQPGAGRAPRHGGAHLHARAWHGPHGLRLADVRRSRRRNRWAPPGCWPRARRGAAASSHGSCGPRTRPGPPSSRRRPRHLTTVLVGTPLLRPYRPDASRAPPAFAA